MGLPLPPPSGPGGPLVDAMNAQNSLALNMLKKKYYGPDMQSQINNRNSLTEGQNISNQYMPDKMRLANTMAELQNQFYAPNIQSEINSRNALTKKTNTMTPLEARELELKNQWYPKTEQANINWKNSGGAGMGVGQKELRGFEDQLSKENPEWTPQQINQAASSYINGDTQLQDGTQLPPISGLGQTFVDQIIKRGATAQGLNQQRFAATTDSLLKKGEELLPAVSQYAGALGKTKGSIDSVKNSLGIDTPGYNDYIYFTRTFVPTAAGEMMRALGINASDTQKEMYKQAINPVNWDQNPQGAIENYKRMQNMFTESIGKTIGKSTGELRAGLRTNKNSANEASDPYKVDYNKPSGSQSMTKEGQLYFIPSNKVKEALSKGYAYAK